MIKVIGIPMENTGSGDIFYGELEWTQQPTRLFFVINQLFRKIISEIPLECQTVWIQIRPDKLFAKVIMQLVKSNIMCVHFCGCVSHDATNNNFLTKLWAQIEH